MFRGLAGFSNVRRRKIVPEGGMDKSLYEPLIPLDENGQPTADEQETSSSDVRHENELSMVPSAVQPFDDLLRSLAYACVEGLTNFCFVLSRCLTSFLPASTPQPLELSEVQERRLRELQLRIPVPYDGANAEHQEALRQLWNLAFPGVPCDNLKNSKWKEMGWQNDNPGTDFRGAGCVSLHNLIYLAKNHPQQFAELKDKQNGHRSDWEYPFAAAGVNLTYMLTDLLDLRDASRTPNTAAARSFLVLLEDSENAFEELFCITFALLDRNWLEMKASYMEFPQVIKRTRERMDEALGSCKPTTLAEVKQIVEM